MIPGWSSEGGVYYAFDLAPRFWESLLEMADAGRVLSIDHVQRELADGKDDLAFWAKTHFYRAFASTADPDVIQNYRLLMEWVQSEPQFLHTAKAEFASIADGWLVAYAKAKGCTVVTHEVLDRHAKKKVPIPNLCAAFGVPCLDPFTMLRRLGVRFA
ncbi:MAG: DUF4411 family protein [Phycisphaerae bacterium]|nr:DUF4411 family protein [Phycisphaerae bacterium]